MILPEDSSYGKATEYFKLKYKRYLSNTVIRESENVILKLKRISLKIINFVKNMISTKNIDLLKIEGFLDKIKRSFVKQYGDNDFPEGIKKERFINIVNEFFNSYRDDFSQSILLNDITNLNTLSKDINRYFKGIMVNLKVFLKKFICITFLNKTGYIGSLMEIGVHSSDAIILDEFYCLSKHLNELIIFITLDKDIFRLSGKINQVFSSKIDIFYLQ